MSFEQPVHITHNAADITKIAILNGLRAPNGLDDLDDLDRLGSLGDFEGPDDSDSLDSLGDLDSLDDLDGLDVFPLLSIIILVSIFQHAHCYTVYCYPHTLIIATIIRLSLLTLISPDQSNGHSIYAKYPHIWYYTL